MKVLFVAGEYFPATAYGGPTLCNLELCRALVAGGLKVTVITTNSNGRSVLEDYWRGWRELAGINVYYARRWLRPDIAPAFVREFKKFVGSSAIVHASAAYHWFLPLIAGECTRLVKPLVVSPHGALLPVARGENALKKRSYEGLLGGKSFRRVTSFHAASKMEADAIRTLIPGSRVAVIPNGVNVPVELPEPACGAEPYLLFMGRLHRYKRVERIIRAFAAAVGEHGAQMPQGSAVVGRERSGRRGTLRDELLGGRWALFVAGDGDADYRRELERFAADSGVGDCVRFVGHVSGEEKAWLLAEAEGLVLASYSENFGMSVAEALAHGTPCLVTKTAPWEGLERERCGLWVDDSEEALTEGMRRLMALSPAERRAMGMRGREWMQRDFSWDNVARRMLTLYEELAGETAERSAAGG